MRSMVIRLPTHVWGPGETPAHDDSSLRSALHHDMTAVPRRLQGHQRCLAVLPAGCRQCEEARRGHIRRSWCACLQAAPQLCLALFTSRLMQATT